MLVRACRRCVTLGVCRIVRAEAAAREKSLVTGRLMMALAARGEMKEAVVEALDVKISAGVRGAL